MRYFLIAVLVILAEAAPTLDTARTQRELNQAGGSQRDTAKQRMDAELARVLLAAKSDPAQVDRIRSAQAAWETYRAAQMKALYGCDGWAFVYGSAAPMCYALAEAALYTQRADELHGMIASTQDDGNICGWNPTCGD